MKGEKKEREREASSRPGDWACHLAYLKTALESRDIANATESKAIMLGVIP